MISLKSHPVWLIVLVIIRKTSALSFNQPKLCSNATWSKNGTTFVDSNTIGGQARGFFINNDDTIFVAAYEKSQILIRSKESTSPVQTIFVNLYQYTSLFATINDDIYFENGSGQGRIEKWAMSTNDTTFVTKFSSNCYGLFVDLNNTLYCSLGNENQVLGISVCEKNATKITIAGNGSSGTASNQLWWPWGIFVDTNFDVYVADARNDRIQLFRSGQLIGTTVAGREIPQHLSLNFPTDVILDGDSYLYIFDNSNSRVIRLGHGEWQCVIGCSDRRGSAPNELYKAYSIDFDSLGNLYVADEYNGRIQKFTQITNSCTQQLTSFIPSSCSTKHGIGRHCNISNNAYDMLQPCQNGGICDNKTKSLYDYNCVCSNNFDGKRCEIDNRPCQPVGCLNNGSCSKTSSNRSGCQCTSGWEGPHCETKVNFCQNVTCHNNCVCRPLFLNYTCECVGDTYYSGRHCETKSRKIIIFTTVSKSCASIAIIVMIIAVMFIVIMDILKYCFGIDPTREDLEHIRQAKLAKKRKPVIQRFVYVNAPPLSEEANRTITESTV